MSVDIRTLFESKRLYGLKDISPVRSWDYSVPTLVRKNRFTDRNSWIQDQTFTDKFYSLFPILKCVELTDFTVMGGCVLDILMNVFPKDIDMFVLTEPTWSEAECQKYIQSKVKSLVQSLYSYMIKKNDSLRELEREKKIENPHFCISHSEFFQLKELKVQFHRNVYTLSIPKTSAHIQIYGKGFNSLPELLASNDIGCAAICWHEGKIVFNELSKFCFESLVFPIDSMKCTPVYASRILKYFQKGFDVMLPRLDMSGLSKKNLEYGIHEVADLPHLIIVYTELKDNQITVQELRPRESVKGTSRFKEYNEASESKTMIMHPGEVIHHNILSMIHNKFDCFVFQGVGEAYERVFDDIPLLTERMIYNSYETFKGRPITPESVARYITVDSLPNVLDKYYVQTAKQSFIGDEFNSAKFEQLSKGCIEELVSRQIAFTSRLLKDLPERIASFVSKQENEEVVSEEEWYGKYFK